MGSLSKIKTSNQSQWHRSSVFIANFEQISHIVPMLTLNKKNANRVTFSNTSKLFKIKWITAKLCKQKTFGPLKRMFVYLFSSKFAEVNTFNKENWLLTSGIKFWVVLLNLFPNDLSRSIFKTWSNIYDEAFCKIVLRIEFKFELPGNFIFKLFWMVYMYIYVSYI